jgi:O-antigen/teichoic acid export membrane protein
MSQIRQAFIFSAINKYTGVILRFILTILLARMIAPEDFGSYVIAAAIISIVAELKSFGLGSHLIRKQELTKEDVKTALGLTILICWTLGSTFIAFSSFIEGFYNKPDIANLVILLSISFFFAPFISISHAILNRELRFKDIMILELSQQFIYFTITLFLLKADYGYFAIGIAAAVSSFFQLFVAIFISTEKMQWKPQLKGAKSMAGSGAILTSIAFVRKLSFALPDVLIGRLGSSADVAIFSKSLGFIDFLSTTITSTVSPIAAPYFAQKNREGAQLGEVFNRATLLLCSIAWPLLAVASLVSESLILLLFGDKWIESAPIASVLCFWAIFKMWQSFFPNLLITVGLEKLLLMKEVLTVILSAFVIYFTYAQGLIYVAVGLSVISLIDLALFFYILTTHFKLNINNLIYSQVTNILVLLSCYFMSFLTVQLLSGTTMSNIIYILIIGTVNVIVWFTTIKVTKHIVLDEINLLAQLLYSKLNIKNKF